MKLNKNLYLVFTLICFVIHLESCKKSAESNNIRIFYEDFETDTIMSKWKFGGNYYRYNYSAKNIGGNYCLELSGLAIRVPFNSNVTFYDGIAETNISNQVGKKALELSAYSSNAGNTSFLMLTHIRNGKILKQSQTNLLSDWKKAIIMDTLDLLQTDIIKIKLVTESEMYVMIDNIELKEKIE